MNNNIGIKVTLDEKCPHCQQALKQVNTGTRLHKFCENCDMDMNE